MRRRGASQRLEIGRFYEVAEDFLDYDKSLHPTGERWMLAGLSHSAEKNRVSLNVQTPEGEWQIPLQLTEDEQLKVTQNIESFLREL